MKALKNISFILFLLLVSSLYSQNEVLVSNVREFSEAMSQVKEGTTIILKNGVWNNARLVANAYGAKENPVIIKAETPGEVIITGNSSLIISGTYVIVEGLWFKDGNPKSKSVVSFKKSSTEFANNCRLTNCVISYFNPSDASLSTHWVDLWGKNNRVDHNTFVGKTNHGTTLVVWLKGEEHIENNHRIDHNLFGERPDLGVNGGETIRIGTSKYSMNSSKTIVENNTFKHCNGEIEIISNKSADNIYRNNLFLESEGTLTLRHGNNALVENNVFIGNNKKQTGGIRVINEGHVVRNNLLIGLTGTELRAPISMMNGVPNSPLNRYHQVKNAEIVNNTLINCSPIAFGVGKDEEKSLAPINSIFSNNLILSESSESPMAVYDKTSGIEFKNNFIDTPLSLVGKELTKVSLELQIVKGLPIPTSSNDFLIVEKTKNASPYDIVNLKRDPFVAGAFNLNNRRMPLALSMKTGTSWKLNIVKPKLETKTVIIDVKPGVKTLSKALKKAGPKAILNLEAGEYIEETTIKVKGDITFSGATKETTIIKAGEKLSKPLNYFFRVQEKSKLTLNRVTLDGEQSTPVKYAVVSPDENKLEKYNLFIDDCIIKNFKNQKGGSVYKAYKGTFADTISIKNTIIKDSYRGLNLSYEKSLLGFYNAENIIIHNSVFSNLEEFAIKYHRNGVNDNLKGGNLSIINSIFNKIANTEKGKIIDVKGIKTVLIKNSVFQNSYEALAPIKLSGENQKITNCVIHNSGTVKISNNAKKENLHFKNPKWEDKQNYIPSKKSILLKANNKIDDIGLITNTTNNGTN